MQGVSSRCSTCSVPRSEPSGCGGQTDVSSWREGPRRICLLLTRPCDACLIPGLNKCVNQQMFSRSFLAAYHTTQEVLEKIPGSFAVHILRVGKTGNRKRDMREWVKTTFWARNDNGGLSAMFLEALKPEREASRCALWVKRQRAPSLHVPSTHSTVTFICCR